MEEGGGHPVRQSYRRFARTLSGILFFCSALLTVQCASDIATSPEATTREAVESPLPAARYFSAREQNVSEFQLLFAGDMHFEWGVREQQRSGLLTPIEHVRRLFDSAALRIANLETAMSDRGSPPPGKPYIFNASPEGLRVLQALRLDAAILANNHSMDLGPEGLRSTLETLRSGGIAAVGAGENLQEAQAPLMLHSHGMQFALFALTLIEEENAAANSGRPGVAIYTPAVLSKIAAVNRQADITIVSLHWGTEYYQRPGPDQVALARSLINAGADLVIGHHPHTPQGAELYRNGLIVYSIGNFLFGSSNEDQTHNILLRLTFSPSEKRAVAAQFVPIWGRFSAQNPRPAPLDAAEARAFAHDFYWQVFDISPETASRLEPEIGGAIQLRIPGPETAAH